jgi:hypothetical protein
VVLGESTQLLYISGDHLHSIGHAKRGDPASQGIHAGLSAVDQNQFEVGAVIGNHQTGHSGTCADVNN